MVIEVFGDGSSWKTDLFPQELIPDILQLVIVSWEIFPKPNPLDHEVSISKEFVKILRAEKNQHYDLPFKIWYELPEIDLLNNEGRIDILFSYIGTPKEEIYFSFECKRLRIPYPSRLVTNSSEYVGNQGMMCFITGKYSRSVDNAGMIGYIMDGKENLAITSVGKHIKKKRNILKLAKNTGLELSSMIPDRRNVRETTHILSEKQLKIYHLFLAV